MARTILLSAPALAAALMASIPAVVTAQEALTLDRAVEQALARNASLRAVRAGAAEGAAQVAEARAGWFPRVSIAESWQRGDEPVFVFSSLLSARRFAAANFAVDALNHPGATGFFRSSVGIEQVLFDGGRQRSAVERASTGYEAANLKVDEAAADVILVTTQTYGRILAADAGRRAAQAALDAAREDLARAERRRDTGVTTDADVLALATHVADLQQRAIQFQGDAAIARAELNRLMGAPVGGQFAVVEPPPAGSASGSIAPLDALLAEADRSRPEVRRAALAERSAAADHRGSRAALIPQVAAQAAFDSSGTSVSDRASAWIVGAEVRWSLSLGGAETARVKATEQARVRAAAEAEDVRSAVHVEVVSALRRREAAAARQAAGRAAVEQARESERIVRDRFDAGLAGVTDVLRASSALLDAEAQRSSAGVDAIVGDAMLRRAIGRVP